MFEAVADASDHDGLPLTVVGLVTDRHDARAIDVAGARGIPTGVVAPGAYPDRVAWDRALADTLRSLQPDWIASLGFMRILGPGVLGAFPNRIVNTHPALLPSFPGAHAVADALAYGVQVSGCTIHLVDSGVDTGPVLAQAAVPVAWNDDAASLHERIKTVERRLVIEVLDAIARGGVAVDPDGGRRARLHRMTTPGLATG